MPRRSGYLLVDSAVAQVGEQTQNKREGAADNDNSGEVVPSHGEVYLLVQENGVFEHREEKADQDEECVSSQDVAQLDFAEVDGADKIKG